MMMWCSFDECYKKKKKESSSSFSSEVCGFERESAYVYVYAHTVYKPVFVTVSK